MAGKSWSPVNPIVPEDLATLASHLSGSLQLGLERLFREHEQRLLAALLPECRCRCTSTDIKNAANARLLGPGCRLHTGNSGNSMTSTARHFPEEHLRLEVRTASKKSQDQCGPTAYRKSHGRNHGRKHSESKKRWFQLPWEHLSFDAAPLVPSGVRSLEEARDSELLAVVPDFEGRYQLQQPSKSSSSSTPIPNNRKWEQLPTFSIDNEAARLPGVVWTSSMDLARSPDSDRLAQGRGPEEKAPGTAAAAMADELHHREGASNGHAAHPAAAASAADASACQFTYEHFAAIVKHDGDLPSRPAAPAAEECPFRGAPRRCHHPERSQGDWATGATAGPASGVPGQSLAPDAHKAACTPHPGPCLTNTTTLEDSLEAVVIPLARQATAQSISTLSSNDDSMMSSCTPEAVPPKLVSERACTGELNTELARKSFRRALYDRKFASDTKLSYLKRERAILGESSRAQERAMAYERRWEMMRPGSRRNLCVQCYCPDTKAACPKWEQELLGNSSKAQEQATASERKAVATKPGSRRHLCTRNYASDTKAVRLRREEELLRGIGQHSAGEQDRANSEQPRQGARRPFQARDLASDTKVTRLKRQEEFLGESSKPSTRHLNGVRAASEPTSLGLHRGLPATVFGSDTAAACRRREGEPPGDMRQPRIRHRQSGRAYEQAIAQERSVEPARPGCRRTLDAEAFAPDAQMVRWKQGETEEPSMLEGIPTLVEESSRLPSPATPCEGEADHARELQCCMGQRVDSPLLLRLCGVLPWGRLWAVHRCVVLLLAACLVAVFVEQLCRGQRRIVSSPDCHLGVCVHFGHLSDLVLSVGSFLGLLAMRTLGSLKLLGSPMALLARFAIEQAVVQKWSCATSWNSLYLAILWWGSLAFRAATMPSGFCWMDAVRACAFMLTSLIFMSLVFSILHVSCLVCILIDNYALKVSKSMDAAASIQEWDKLGALLRNVSRAVDRGFVLVQITAVAILLSSFTDLMLQGDQQIWHFFSNMLLAQSLILSLSKAAEATEMCTRLPSLINSMDFRGDDFSPERHYLVEHISYSAAGFYVGEIRLTAAMALRGMYISMIVALGVLTKLTQVTTI